MKNTCKNCGINFTPKVRGAKGRAQQYCSTSCGLSGATPSRKVVCIDCGIPFTYYGRGRCYRCNICRKSRIRKQAARWQAENRTRAPGVGFGGAQWDDQNHRYKHGKCEYKGDYRRLCLKNHDEVCVICKGTNNVDVHHIDGDKSRCDADNLVPLCRSCHKRVHYAISRFTPTEVYIKAFKLVEAEVKSRNEAGTACEGKPEPKVECNDSARGND